MNLSSQDIRQQERDNFRYVEALRIRPGDWCVGTPYPTDHERFFDLCQRPGPSDIVKYAKKIDPENPGVSLEEATAKLEHRLQHDNPFVFEIEYIVHRLSALVELRNYGAWGGDLVLKAFDDLDRTIFGAAFRHHCCVRWRSEESLLRQSPQNGNSIRHRMYLGQAYTRKVIRRDPGTNSDSECQFRLVELNLNATAIFLAPRRPGMSRWQTMWAVLLDFMVRGFIFLTVEAHIPQFPSGENLHPCIRRCLEAVSHFTQIHFNIQAGCDLATRQRIKDEVVAEMAALALRRLGRGIM